MRERERERDRPIYLYATEAWSGRCRWYSIEDEQAQGEDQADYDDDDDPILTVEGNGDRKSTDRFKRLQVPIGSRNYLFEYRHVVVNDTLYAMGAHEFRSYNLLEKQQSGNPDKYGVVQYRSNLLLQQSQSQSQSCSKISTAKISASKFSTAKISRKICPVGIKLLVPPEYEPIDRTDWQFSAVALDNGWIYTLGGQNWGLDVTNGSGKRLDLPKAPELPPDEFYVGDGLRLLGATQTKLFAYMTANTLGKSNILYCLDLENSHSQWKWKEVKTGHWQAQFSTGVVLDFDDIDGNSSSSSSSPSSSSSSSSSSSYLICCGIQLRFQQDGSLPPAALYVFDIKNGVWLKEPVEGDLQLPLGICAVPYLVDIGHQKLAVVYRKLLPDNFMEVTWVKFTINSLPASTPTFSTQLVSSGARRIYYGFVQDCTPGILLNC